MLDLYFMWICDCLCLRDCLRNQDFLSFIFYILEQRPGRRRGEYNSVACLGRLISDLRPVSVSTEKRPGSAQSYSRVATNEQGRHLGCGLLEDRLRARTFEIYSDQLGISSSCDGNFTGLRSCRFSRMSSLPLTSMY